MATISPTQSNVQAALTAFLAEVLPGLSGAPAVFIGSIAGTTLTVTGLPGRQPAGIQGTIQLNSPLLGLGVAPGTIILAQLSGVTGGAGIYQISISQTISQPVTMSTGVTIIAGQQNRTAEPNNPYFAVFVPINFERLATNFDGYADCKFTGSIVGNVMTVSDVADGQISPGATVFGTGVSSGTTVIQQLSGATGGAGTYQVSPAQTSGSATLSAGQKMLTQPAECVCQIDFHSPDSLAGDFAQIVSTSIRDSFGVNFFANLPPPFNGVVPFYADSPAMRPFQNAEQQWEWRFSLDAKFEVDQTVSVAQTFADAVTVTLEDVDAVFPP